MSFEFQPLTPPPEGSGIPNIPDEAPAVANPTGLPDFQWPDLDEASYEAPDITAPLDRGRQSDASQEVPDDEAQYAGWPAEDLEDLIDADFITAPPDRGQRPTFGEQATADPPTPAGDALGKSPGQVSDSLHTSSLQLQPPSAERVDGQPDDLQAAKEPADGGDQSVGDAFAEPLRQLEMDTSPEATMQDLVTVTEADLMAHSDPGHGHPGRFGGRELGGFCRSASHVLEYYAKQDGHQAATYQLRDVHETFNDGATDPQDIREAAFGHAAAVVRIGSTVFLGDHTFGQFCDGDTIRQSDGQDTGIPSTDPLAQQLIQDCYVPLTDTTLRAYMRLTTGASPEEASYIDGATVDRLLTDVTPLKFYFSDAEIASGAMWHGVPCTELPSPCVRPTEARHKHPDAV